MHLLTQTLLTYCTFFISIRYKGIRGDDPINAHILAIYNADLTIWHQFSIGRFGKPLPSGSLQLIWKNPKKGLIPFADVSWGGRFYILRIVKESSNWYEVVVNEKTDETRYVLKNDRAWEKTRLDYWFYYNSNMHLTQKDTQLYSKPDGEVIEETKDSINRHVIFLKMQGDWVYVRAIEKYSQQTLRGWVRWRKGKQMLVGNIYNNNKVLTKETQH